MRKSTTILIGLACILSFSWVNAQPLSGLQNNSLPANLLAISQPVQQTQPVRQIISSTENELIIRYNFSGITVAAANRGEVKYQYLHIANFPKMGKVGKPALPAHNDLIMVPGSGYDIQVLESPYKEYAGFNIHPALEAASDEAGQPEPQFQRNDQVYSTNAFWPNEIVEPEAVQKVRGITHLVLQLRPVQFNPVTKTIRLYSHITYKITFNGSKSNYQSLKYRSTDHYLKSLQSGVLNSNILPKKADNSTKSSQAKDIILLTTPSYQAAADTLALWKRQLGYTVKIITSSSWTSAAVKDSVHTLYQNWNPHPDYLIILGDQADVPAEQIPYSTTYYLTDLYYVCMDGTGDYTADMARGRISVSSSTEAMTVIQKIVNYERNPVADASFYNSVMSCAYFQDGSTYTSYIDGYADRRFLHTAEEIKSYLDVKNYNVSRTYFAFDNRTPTNYNNGYYSDGQAIPSDLLVSNGFDWDGGTADINSKINAGAFLLYHRDHGYTDGYGWEHPYYLNQEANALVNDGNNINALSNGDKLPIVFSVNCHTGDFKRPECFAENFLRKSGGGAVGVIAPSYASYSGYNDAFITGLVDAIWSNPGLVPDFGFGGTANPSLNSHGDIRCMGDVMNQGLLRMVQTWASSSKWQRQNEMYHYFGDPTMKIWTSAPTTFSLNTLPSLIRLDSSLQINVSNGADAQFSLIVDGEVFATGNLVNGQANIPFVLDSIHDAIFTLSKENYKPYIKKIQIDNTIKPTPPTFQASNIRVISDGKSYAVSLEWDKGDGDYSLVKVSSDGTFTAPVDGVEYPADNVYAGGGEQVVYNGSGNEAEILNLTDGEVYWFRVYEYNNEGIYTLYQTITETDNPKASDGSGQLPVELSVFKATVSDGKVNVEWVTSSEVNNNYFILERSFDGLHFSPLEQVAGNGNSNVPIYYQVLDASPHNGLNYYRLKQIDFDGQSEVFEAVSVMVKGQNGTIVQNTYVSDQNLSIHLNSSEGDVVIKLLNLAGSIVYERVLSGNQDIQKHTIPTDPYAKGMYILYVQGQGLNESKKIILK
jgi:hypothetical protein